MHVAIVPRSAACTTEVTRLVAEGHLQRIEARDEVGRLGADDHVLLHVDEIETWLSPLSERCRGGKLGSIRILIDGEAPPWERIGFRVRPWVQAIQVLGSPQLPTGTTPAPILHSSSLEEILQGWDEPAFRASEIPTAFPPKLQVETTAHCGLDCPYCPKATQAPDRTRMGEDLFCKIMAECTVGQPDSIELYLSGDPLTDPRLEHLADLAKAASPSSLIEIITHERSINERRAQRLAASGLDAVFVSVNFPDPTTVAAMRTRLERVARIRKIFLAHHKQLVIVTLTNLFDVRGRADFDAITGDLGLPFERFRATNRLGDVDLGKFPAAAAAAPVAARVCERPFTKAYIRARGDVLLCCEDWNDRWVLGNVAHTPLAEIWGNALYRERRRSLLAGKPFAPCDQCTYAGTANATDTSRVATSLAAKPMPRQVA